MRIALVNNFFLPRTSGSAHQVAQLATELASRDHEVLVLTSAQGMPPGNYETDGYRVFRLPCMSLPPLEIAMRYDVNFALSIRNGRKIARLLDEFRPDVLHQHGQFFDLTWMTGIWSRSRACPTALTVHTPLMHTNRAYSAVLWSADVLFVRNLLRRWSPSFVATDVFMRNYVSTRYRVPTRDITVIPLGVDPEQMRNGNAATVRNSLGIGDRPMVLSLGHVIPLRNRLLIVEALPRLIDICPDIVLVVVGVVNDDRFLRRAEELGIDKHVITTGPVPYQEVPSYIAAASLECHEEGLGSGLGTATLEVMGAGTPVVAVADRDSFVGFTLGNWEEVVLVKPNDPEDLAQAMATLILDPSLAKRVGHGGQELIEREFTHETAADRHIDLYLSMMNGERVTR